MREAREEAARQAEAARRDEAQAIAEVQEAEAREAEEIAEALRRVEEALEREERDEMDNIMRAVAAAERGMNGTAATAAPPAPPGPTEPTAAGPTSSATTMMTQGSLAELQLAALMELGFHAQQVLPLCDGVTPIEELVETLIASGGTAPDAHGTADSTGVATGVPIYYPGGSRGAEYDPFGSTGGTSRHGRPRTQGGGIARRFGFGSSRR